MNFSNHELVTLIKDNIARVSHKHSEYSCDEARRLAELASELADRLHRVESDSERSLRAWDADYRPREDSLQ